MCVCVHTEPLQRCLEQASCGGMSQFQCFQMIKSTFCHDIFSLDPLAPTHSEIDVSLFMWLRLLWLLTQLTSLKCVCVWIQISSVLFNLVITYIVFVERNPAALIVTVRSNIQTTVTGCLSLSHPSLSYPGNRSRVYPALAECQKIYNYNFIIYPLNQTVILQLRTCFM